MSTRQFLLASQVLLSHPANRPPLCELPDCPKSMSCLNVIGKSRLHDLPPCNKEIYAASFGDIKENDLLRYRCRSAGVLLLLSSEQKELCMLMAVEEWKEKQEWKPLGP